ncbi:GTP-binding protein [Alkalihalobacillus alcalophilus ATCC 27647 = CGMCC 1.3604]|uniref:GTPase HflX n=1 Tax=Alkalihalobacillus alcalophilus ATCC 27647 = CGMCC 1.3604 TaxID=1218173 RepID=A0A094WFJ7_ALKAL|nr:GTPase HflX [Alkalihalobacillus alcalophilus]KGA96554.1 GTP-binding protein [Alkalihalobacillus alcalophilus ATCC 27647 = CGMCC 1.3604]MED1564138.1 GTPase HflX [Alkalihalobacillus alcalophilus]THG91851.1 GTP-binding protein [Alkalihalobacillus alcalophilus ATCC 27647 = CGMCC 1.3604]
MQEEQQVAILVGAELQQQSSHERSMDELEQLAFACEVAVEAKVSQRLEKINPSTYIGAGKLLEVKQVLSATDANLVIFDDELSPSQIRNTEQILECKVIDRTILILDIFAQRAKTKEAKLQVELAKLQYMLPRLVGLRQSLGRQSGGVGTTNRGAGETKLELDRRKIEEKMSILSKELERLVKQRQIQRGRRQKQEMPVVALVGYTNAGKSTLMNAFLQFGTNASDKKYVFEENMLFATLETSVRKVTLPKNRSFLLTDTVGFVNKLPHHLVKAFRSTLEEVKEADLLLHVVDYSNPNYEQQIQVTNETLKEIGVENIPMIYLFNKSELVDDKFHINREDSLYVSAREKKGFEALLQTLELSLFATDVKVEFLFPYTAGEHVHYFQNHADVLEMEHQETGTYMKVICRLKDKQKYEQFMIKTV